MSAILEYLTNFFSSSTDVQGSRPSNARHFVPEKTLREGDAMIIAMLNSNGHEDTCYCICDPYQSDVPIIFASDGWVPVKSARVYRWLFILYLHLNTFLRIIFFTVPFSFKILQVYGLFEWWNRRAELPISSRWKYEGEWHKYYSEGNKGENEVSMCTYYKYMFQFT